MRVAAERASGCRYGAALARSSGVRIRAAAAVAGSAPASSASDDEQLGAVDRLQPVAGRRLGGAEVDDHRAVVGDDDVGRAQRPVGEAGPVQCPRPAATPRRAARPRARRERACRAVALRRRPWPATIEPSGSDVRARSSGQLTPFPPGEEQQQSFVLDARGRATRPASRRRDRAGAARGSRGTAGRRRGCRARTP